MFTQGLNFSSRAVILLILDLLLISAAIYLSAYLRLGMVEADKYILWNLRSLSASVAIFLLVFYVSGMYERQVLAHRKGSFAGIFVAVVIGLVFVILLFYAKFDLKIGRGILLISGFFIAVFTWINRRFYAAAVGYGMFHRNALVVGDAEQAARVIRLIRKTPDSGYRLFGVIGSSRPAPGTFVEGLPILGNIESLKEFCQAYDIETVVVATSLHREPALLRVLRPLRYQGIEILDYAGLYEQLAQEIPIDHIDDEWLMHAAMNSSRIHIRKLKRVMDVGAAIVGLVLSAPISLLAAIAVKFDSPGPVLYRQVRSGLDGEPFTVVKFRTMTVDAEKESGAVWASHQDVRVTRVGKVLRKTRIDEIPQLWNILMGTMSLVGPRPERPIFIESLACEISFYRERLLVPPGLTGWAQVMYPYAASIDSSRRKLQYDLYYIKHMGMFLDVLILLRTIKTILVGMKHSENFDAAEAEEIAGEEKIIRIVPRPKTLSDTSLPASQNGESA